MSEEGLQERCKALQSLLDEASRKVTTLEAMSKNLEDQNSHLKIEFHSKDEELKRVRNDIKGRFESERKFMELSNQFDEYKKRYAVSEEERKGANAKNAELETLRYQNDQLEDELNTVIKS